MNERAADTSLMHVTTVLPTNRLNQWVDDAVQSALAQDHHNHEVLVVHDGLDPELQRPWVRDPRVTCVTTGSSQGLAHALAFGIQRASGEYIARLDGDDLAEPTRVTRQLALLVSSPRTAVVGTLAHRIDESGEVTGKLGIDGEGDLRPVLLTRNALIHSSVLFPRALYDEVGGYDRRLLQMEDYHLWLRLAMVGEVRVVPEQLTRYRVHSQQMTRTGNPQGDYLKLVLEARLRLADAMGRSKVAQRARNQIWRAAQVARYRGWRAPGYAR